MPKQTVFSVNDVVDCQFGDRSEYKKHNCFLSDKDKFYWTAKVNVIQVVKSENLAKQSFHLYIVEDLEKKNFAIAVTCSHRNNPSLLVSLNDVYGYGEECREIVLHTVKKKVFLMKEH